MRIPQADERRKNLIGGEWRPPATGQHESRAARTPPRHLQRVAAALHDAPDDPDLEGVVETVPDEAVA